MGHGDRPIADPWDEAQNLGWLLFVSDVDDMPPPITHKAEVQEPSGHVRHALGYYGSPEDAALGAVQKLRAGWKPGDPVT